MGFVNFKTTKQKGFTGGLTLPKAKKTSADNLDTSEGLYGLAVKSGLQKQADSILSTKGEETNKIFSGGFISDIFDGLNALQYGVVGMLKGKGFSEGVRTRQSFSDKDALGDNGLPGVVGGIALDIAVDPLTYIAPWTAIKKIPGAEKLIRVAGETFEGSKVGQYLGQKFVYMFGQDPVFREGIERSIKNIAVGNMNIKKLVEGIIDIPKDKARLLLSRDKTGRFIRTPVETLRGKLTDDELFNVSKAYAILDDMGKQAVDLKLLSKGKWEENLGEYIKNAYTKYEAPKEGKIFGFIKQKVIGIKPRKKGLTPEKMAELGQIDNPAYLLFKSMINLNHDIENTKLFNIVAKTFGSDVAKEGFEKLPEGISRGMAAGKFVPKNIYNYLTDIQQAKTDAEKGLAKVVAGFKFGKVILNPATHARNVISNTLLNWWKLGLGPWRADIYGEAAGQIAKGGKWIDEAKTVGYNLDTFAANEIKALLLSDDGINGLGKFKNKASQYANKLADIYQQEENFAKLSAFIFKRKQGLGIEEAWKAAESATFNYAQVSPFIRKLRTNLFGFPFITFTAKATPLAAETALKAPHRISALGKIKNSIENQADIKEIEKERASEPQWIRDGFYIKLPIKDKFNRSAYFDLTYIIPFGDLMSGQYFTTAVKRETGLKESLPESLTEKTPVINFIKEISRNQDFYGDRIWQESDPSEKQLGDLFRHLTKTYMPPLVSDQIPGGYIEAGKEKGQRRQKGIISALEPKTEENIKQQRTLMQEMLRQVGMKIQPIDVDIQETYMEWEKKKALTTLLKESGIMSEFNRAYVPKNK